MSSYASPSPASAQVGVVGLAVMGNNLARNFASRGYAVALYNRTQARTDAMMAAHGTDGAFVPAESVADFVASLERPRRVIMMVQAGDATDATIAALLPHLEPGDILVDGGNAHFPDTRRREAALREVGIHFVGAGISGGEEGALTGPSIMPGGPVESYDARSARCSSRSLLSSTVSPAARTSARTVPGTSSRWSTTASSTPTCS